MNLFDLFNRRNEKHEESVTLCLSDNLIRVDTEILTIKKILQDYVALNIKVVNRDNPEIKSRVLLAVDLIERYNEFEARLIELGNPDSPEYHEVEDEYTERMFLIKLGFFFRRVRRIEG